MDILPPYLSHCCVPDMFFMHKIIHGSKEIYLVSVPLVKGRRPLSILHKVVIYSYYKRLELLLKTPSQRSVLSIYLPPDVASGE